MATEKKKPQNGNAARVKAGLVAIALYVTPEERDLIDDAAHADGRKSKAAFARESVLARAREVLAAQKK